VENSPMLTSRGLGTVLGDLASMGFDAEWGVLSAADVGANHKRERIWIVGQNTKQHRFFSHTKHDRDGWGEQFKESVEEKNVAYTDNFDDAMRGDGQDYEKSMGIRGYEPRGSVSHSGSRCKEGAGESKSLVAHSNSTHGERNEFTKRGIKRHALISESSWWETEPDVGRVADGVAARMDRLKAIGNGQVPLCAATAFKLLTERLNGTGPGH